ncbi:MAG TPA: TetR family transcriptional regulator [Gammaproteobacteria bacterium]|jgi:TetR/AcrR family acrAB operon transcriptional repressor
MARKTKEEASRTRQQIIDAAQAVFHRNGVSRSTLEQIAREAGVTRGAVYWHFKDKAELFAAMRENVFTPMRERIDSILFAERFADPLDAIEASLQELFRVLEDCPKLRQVFEIMVLRCEYVGEFAEVRAEANKPAMDFQAKIKNAYRSADARGTLRKGLDPDTVALDTWAFVNGLLHDLLGNEFKSEYLRRIGAMISSHMALRRPE